MVPQCPWKSLSSLSRIFATWFALTATLVSFSMTAASASAQDRPQATEGWTDSSGEKTLTAEFVKLEGVQLTLRKADGTEIVIPLNKLDDKSRLKARAMAKNGGKAPLAKSTEPASFPSRPTAQEFMDIILRELKNENPMVIWDALPASKQKQVQEVVKLASSRVEQRTMNLVKKFRTDLLSALRSKKQFVLNSGDIPIPPDKKDALAKSYDPLVALLEACLPVEWLDTSYLQQAEMRDLLSSYVHNIVIKAKDVEKSMAGNNPLIPMMNYAVIEAKVEEVSAKEAMITLVVPGQPETPTKFLLSDGRWLPEALLGSWDQQMGQATVGLGQVDPKVIHQTVGQGLIFANGLLGTISTAETQQDFDEAIGQLMGMAQMIPGIGGGLAPPGPGGPGRPQRR